jgi:hypothetical protein
MTKQTSECSGFRCAEKVPALLTIFALRRVQKIDDLSKTGISGLDGNITTKFSNEVKKISPQEQLKYRNARARNSAAFTQLQHSLHSHPEVPHTTLPQVMMKMTILTIWRR